MVFNNAVSAELYLVQHVLDCYVKMQKMWYEEFGDDDYKLFEWYNDYEQ